MGTVLELITDSLLVCQVLAAGDAPEAGQAQQALRFLNRLLASWRTDRLLVYGIDRQVFATVASTGTYTLGPGGTWNTTPLYGASVARPVRVERAGFVDNSQTPALEIPLRPLVTDEYQAIHLKGTTSVWPLWFYYDLAYPLGTVTLWPVPTVSRQIALYLWRPLTQFASLAADVEFPPGYEEALVYSLADRLAPTYGMTLGVRTLQLVIETKAAIQSLNSEAPLMSVDPLVFSGHGGGFNWMSGEEL